MSVLVFTTVRVAEGDIDEVAALFDATNGDLVAGHDEWLGAWFTARRDQGVIVNVAHWSTEAGYRALQTSDEFAATMARFGPFMQGPPEVVVHEVLVEMHPDA